MKDELGEKIMKWFVNWKLKPIVTSGMMTVKTKKKRVQKSV